MRAKRRGISILIEAIVVAVMVIGAFAVSYFYITPSNPTLQRSGVNLNQLGFNILNSLGQQKSFDESIINGTALFNIYNNCNAFNVSYACIAKAVVPGWQRTIGLALQTLVPQGYIYNLTVSLDAIPPYSPYNLTSIPLNNGVVISNGSPVAFKNAAQVADVPYVYTTPKLYVLVFQLQLAQVTSP